MAKIKVKQIEDLLLNDLNLTVGAGKVEFSAVPENGGYVSGFGVVDGVIKPTFKALPLADIFSTGLKAITPEGATGPRTITLDDAYVRTLFEIATSTTEPVESSTFVTGIAYDKPTGKFTYTTGTTVAAKDGKLLIKFGDNAATETGFSANSTNNATLTFANVASTGKAEDVTIADLGDLIAATTVEGALAELAQKATDITVTGKDAIKVAEATGEGATGKVVSLKLADGEKVLSQTADGLKSTLNLTYDSTDKKIKLWGISETNPIATVDAADFIKDGMLDGAEYVELTEGQVGGQTAGKYIHLIFNTDAGKEDIYVNVTALVDTYTAKANDWIVLEPTKKEFSHKTQTGKEQVFAGTNDTTAQTPAFGGTVEISIPKITVDAAGHVTGKPDYTTAKFTLPELPVAATYYQHYDSYTVTAENATAGTVALNDVVSNGTPVVYLNGQSLIEGTGKDYTYSDTTITVTLTTLGCSLEAGDVLSYSYINTTAPQA